MEQSAASTWAELSEQERSRYRDKLGGIYGYNGDESAYNSLTQDKHEALRLISERLVRADLWQYVGRIVIFCGGVVVGLSFRRVGDWEAELGGGGDSPRWSPRH